MSVPDRIDNEYEILDRIGDGGFGTVYKVRDREGHERAAKFVSYEHGDMLRIECDAMLPISGKRSHGTCYKYFFGRHGIHYVLVMDLLGKTLWDLSDEYNGISKKSVLMLGIQMTKRVEKLHSRGYIHRDIKPDNFMIGRPRDDNHCVYLIDFGFAETFKDRLNHHKPRMVGQGFLGTTEFMSRHSHRGETQSRRSDLESLVYTLIFLFTRTLPWEGKSDMAAGKMKEKISAGVLCNGAPRELESYYRYVRALEYSERPKYGRLRQYLVDAMRRYGYANDNNFEWT